MSTPLPQPATYPLDHLDGYAPWPRSAGRFEPLIRDHVALACYMVIWSRVAHEPGWRRGSRGNVHLERGQALLGHGELGQAIGVSKTAAGKALARLESVGLIRANGDRSGTIVTLPFYGEFGDLADARCPQGVRKVSDECSQGVRKVSLTNGETDKRINGRTLFDAAGVEGEIATADKAFWDELVKLWAASRRVGKAKGIEVLKPHAKTAAAREQLKARVEQWSAFYRSTREEKFIPQWLTFCRSKDWQDSPPERGPATARPASNRISAADMFNLADRMEAMEASDDD